MSVGRRLRRWHPAAPLLSLFLNCGTAHAEGQQPLSEILPQLIGSTIVLQPTNLPDQPNHAAHFQPGDDQLLVPGQFNSALLTLLSTYPVGTPSGGFTYTFDQNLGTFERTSESFGPAFAERALTIGRGRVSLGFGFQHASYDTFEGLNLRQRGVTFYVPHVDCCSRGGGTASVKDDSRLTPAFEGDLVRASLALDLVTDTSVVFFGYGVSDRLDVGVTVPFLRVSMDANVLARIERLSTAAEPELHAFSGTNPDEQRFAAAGSASGLGDIVLRAKYHAYAARGGGLAAALDLRVPTGDESNLLGTGGVQARFYGVASFEAGPVSPHLNIGYTASSQGALPGTELRDEVNAALGFDVALSPRATMAVSVLGRTLLGAGRLREADKVFEFAVGGGGGSGGGGGGGGGGTGGGGGSRPADDIRTLAVRELDFQSGKDLRLYFGSVSARLSPWRSLLVTAGLLFPMTGAGVRDRVTPVIGLVFGL